VYDQLQINFKGRSCEKSNAKKGSRVVISQKKKPDFAPAKLIFK